MGKISILTKEQKNILDLISSDSYFVQDFYFTGGIVLSEYYLHHRYSEDLDFFSEKDLDQQVILTLMTKWGEKLNFRFESRFVEVVFRFNLYFNNGANFKVDFGYYPYRRLEKGPNYRQLEADSLRDIAVNKLTTVNQRTEVKDFVDLYFLLKDKFTIWDLLYGSEVKFRQMDIDNLLLSQDLLKAEDFTSLPRMIKPLTLNQLKKFFREKAIETGKKSIIL